MGTMPPKGRADYLALGDWNVACSMCGRKRKASTTVKNWQGLWRCPEHNEPRQPQDFSRGVPDNMSVPFVQREEDLFVVACTINGSSAVAGVGVATCMRAGNKFWNPGLT